VNDLIAVVTRDGVEMMKDLTKVPCYQAFINGISGKGEFLCTLRRP
jgi:hypothetical protein